MTRKLHIGGTHASEGWEVLNANAASYVDHCCDAKNLPGFPDHTFSEIYASHVVEHLDYKDELSSTLKEWNRILVPGGIIYISVPDMDILAQLFLARDQLDMQERYFVMQMMFGGHLDKYDYHVVGLNHEFLNYFLSDAGYVNIRRVDNFGIFNDTSTTLYKGTAISLNLIAEKPAIDS
ncbi:MAG: methyltransferase domain-containing protein [Gammaproteobacteria bacterium]